MRDSFFCKQTENSSEIGAKELAKIFRNIRRYKALVKFVLLPPRGNLIHTGIKTQQALPQFRFLKLERTLQNALKKLFVA